MSNVVQVNKSAGRIFNKPLSQYQQQMVADLNNGILENIVNRGGVRSRAPTNERVHFRPTGVAILIPYVTNESSLAALLANDEITQDVFEALLENAFVQKNDVLLKLMLADPKMANVDKKMLNDEFRKRPYELACLLP